MLHTTQESPGLILVLTSDAHPTLHKTPPEAGPEPIKRSGHLAKLNYGKAQNERSIGNIANLSLLSAWLRASSAPNTPSTWLLPQIECSLYLAWLIPCLLSVELPP